MTVCTPPVITMQPASVTIVPGQPATLAFSATGSGPLHVQWYTSANAPIPGATATTLTVAPAQTTSYYAVVTNACGFVQTAAATVSVTCDGPAIVAQPSSVTINPGQSATLSLTATGTAPLSIDWFVSGGAQIGSGPSIAVAPAATTQYFARVTNACGAVQSATVTVTVNCPKPVIVTHPESQFVQRGGAASFSVLAHGDVTYRWFRSDPAGSTFVPVEGVTSNVLHIIPENDVSQYFARVTNSCGFTDSNIATVTLCEAPVITQQPQSATIEAGETIAISAQASGEGVLYRWMSSTDGNHYSPVRFTGETIWETPHVTTHYYCDIYNDCGMVRTDVITVTVNGCIPPQITQQPQSQTIRAGESATLTFEANGGLDHLQVWYSWYSSTDGVNFAPIGDMHRTITVEPETTTWYFCRVGNYCRDVDTDIVQVTVQP